MVKASYKGHKKGSGKKLPDRNIKPERRREKSESDSVKIIFKRTYDKVKVGKCAVLPITVHLLTDKCAAKNSKLP